MSDTIIEFLEQSNFIEDERSRQALNDAVKAWMYIEEQQTLTEVVIRHTHRILMGTRPVDSSWKGAWRTGPVWIGRREAPKYYAVPVLMEHWLSGVGLGITVEDREEMIKRQHIQFERIHPFFDGNGRIGRILMNWERMKTGLPILVISEEDKHEYYKWFNDL